MGDREQGLEHLVTECRTVAENSLYNAQTHHELANTLQRRADRKAVWMVIVPSAIAAVSGFLTAIGLPSWLGAFSAVGGFLAAISTVLGGDKSHNRHCTAASQWTALRHEARSLQETYFRELPHAQFLAEVRRINDRYNTLCQALEPTDKESFDKARKRIQSGIFSPDFQKTND